MSRERNDSSLERGIALATKLAPFGAVALAHLTEEIGGALIAPPDGGIEGHILDDVRKRVGTGGERGEGSQVPADLRVPENEIG